MVFSSLNLTFILPPFLESIRDFTFCILEDLFGDFINHAIYVVSGIIDNCETPNSAHSNKMNTNSISSESDRHRLRKMRPSLALVGILWVAAAKIPPKVPFPEGPQGARLIAEMRAALERGRRDGASAALVSAMVYYTPAFGARVRDPVRHAEEVTRGANAVFRNSRVPLSVALLGVERLRVWEDPDGLRRLDRFLFAKSGKLPEFPTPEQTLQEQSCARSRSVM